MTLTEQWKKGELPCGWYYIKIADIVFIDFFEGKVWKNKKDKYIVEVLAPVPSYEEWKTVFNCANKYEVEYIECANDYENVKKENQQLKEDNRIFEEKIHNSYLKIGQLKELLKECGQKFFEAERNYGFDDSIVDICSPMIDKITNAIGEK